MSLHECSIQEIADEVQNGTLLGVPADYSGVPMAFVRELIRQGKSELDLFCLPQSTLQADMLIGAGCVRSVETAAVTLGEYGQAPCFTRFVQEGRLNVKDSTCPALHAALQATERAVPFSPLRGLIGSDLVKHRPDWQVISNPFSDQEDPVILIPAVSPDVTVIHAQKADKNGNVWIGRRKEVATLIHASKRNFVTVEEIVDTDFYEDEVLAAGVLPGFYIEAIAVAKDGAWPLALSDRYPIDEAHLKDYATRAKTEEGFATYLAENLAA